MEKGRWLSVFFISFLLSLTLVSAQSASGGLLEPIFQTLADLRIIEGYERFPYVVDLILFLIFFIGLARFILTERIGSVASMALGITMAVGVAFFEYSMQRSFIQMLGPVGMLMIVLVLGVFLYLIIMRAGGQTRTAAMAAYVIVFALLMAAFPPLVEYMRKSQLGNALFGVMMLLWIIALVYCIVNFARNWGGGEPDVAGQPNFWERTMNNFFRRPGQPGGQQQPQGGGGQPPAGQGQRNDMDAALDELHGRLVELTRGITQLLRLMNAWRDQPQLRQQLRQQINQTLHELTGLVGEVREQMHAIENLNSATQMQQPQQARFSEYAHTFAQIMTHMADGIQQFNRLGAGHG